MFKHETVVYLVLCITLGFGLNANAADVAPPPAVAPSSATDSSYVFAQDYRERHCVDHLYGNSPEATACRKLESLIAAGKTTDGCTDAQSKFTNATSEFGDACGKANISTGTGPLGNCEEAMARCQCDSPDKNGGYVGKVECGYVETPSGTSASDRKKLSRFGYCPGKAASNYDKLEERHDKLDSEAKEKEDGLSKKLDEANDAQSEGDDKIRDLEKQRTDANKKFEAAQLEATNKLAESQQGLKDKIAQLKAQEDQADDTVTELDLKAEDARIGRDATQAQIRLNCHASAVAQASKAMGEAADKIRAGSPIYFRAKDLLKKAGTTFEQTYTDQALRIYKVCMASTPTQDALNNAEAAFQAAVNKAKAAQASALKKKAAFADQITKLADPKGQCPPATASPDGMTNESSACTLLHQSQAALAAAKSALQQDLNQINSDEKAESDKATRKYNLKMADYMKDSQDAAKKRAEADSLERMLQSSEEAGGGDVEKGAYQTAAGKYQQAISTARVLLTCPNACPNHDQGSCKTAADFLEFVGAPIPTAPSTDTPPPAPPADSGTGTDAHGPGTGKAGEPSKSHTGAGGGVK